MFGWKRQRAVQLTPHQIAVWLANHATEVPANSTQRQVYFRAAVLLETEQEERVAAVNDLLGQ